MDRYTHRQIQSIFYAVFHIQNTIFPKYPNAAQYIVASNMVKCAVIERCVWAPQKEEVMKKAGVFLLTLFGRAFTAVILSVLVL